ncbi:hypothetical protein ACHAXA_011340 [Cyclostephanos tholiformis]|uniref:Uncharacterized protein n=1 Tax=Cyclostephanos tholiformis TaxID=382380 RepID=A0ABD3RLD1_9STRA
MAINKRAILSGALGATASFIAKLALSPDSPVPIAVHSVCIAGNNAIRTAGEDDYGDSSSSPLCSSASLLARGLCLLSMIGINALMIGSFLDGMNESGSVVGTALSTAANFSCSVRGYFVLVGIAIVVRHRPRTVTLCLISRCCPLTILVVHSSRNDKKAVYGVMFFGEYVPIAWYFGSTLIASGMWLLSTVTLLETA